MLEMIARVAVVAGMILTSKNTPAYPSESSSNA